MDALSSQANVGGYKAVLIAANTYGRYFPLLTTAAGTAKPANVLILGHRRRRASRRSARRAGSARSCPRTTSGPRRPSRPSRLGAKFVKLKTAIDATGAGGYARELTAEERAAQQADLNEVIASQDVVITTAQVPGRKPPLLVTADAVRAMRSGSVIVDMAASALGGNCELSKAGETVVTENGVTIVAPENLPASMPSSASQFYARNISALLKNMVKDGDLNLDFEEEVTKATVITHGGAVVSEAVQKLLDPGRRQRMSELDAFLSNLTIFVARDPVRLRGHLEGARHPAHPADVGRQLDPRHRARGRDVHRRSPPTTRSRTCCRSSPSRSRRSTSSAATS